MPHTELPKNPHVEIRDVGVWRIVRLRSNGPFLHWSWSWITQLSHVVNTHVHLIRCVSTLTWQLIANAPIYFAFHFAARLYQTLKSVIDLYSTKILLDSVC
jgi:hypothetical protein